MIYIVNYSNLKKYEMTNDPSPIFVIKPKVIPIVIVANFGFIIFSIILLGGLSILGLGIVYIVYVLIRGYYKNLVYEIYKDQLIIKTNFIISSETIVQYKNILDITKYQGPIQASFNLHNITIRLAGDQHNYSLNNLEKAQAIFDFLNKTKNLDKS